ncbi:putative flavin-binding monooxygenase [Xylariaceae sp. FL1272]|nr:putative flavin-binding monooxygenase [Xylariaceae sp. FL1272]
MASMAITNSAPEAKTFDIVIIGAGISGINCSYRLQEQLPDKTFTVLEARDDFGGTWDLFKYPGIRSDSDLYTFGFAWEPWPYETPIAEGPLIKEYMRDCIKKYNLGQYFRYKHQVRNASWDRQTEQWTVQVEHDGQTKYFKGHWLIMGTGYYDYHEPFQTEIPGIANFKGKTIHPQYWPPDYDYSGKKMAVIGSGATAVSLIPVLAKTALMVTMIQRSPTWIVNAVNGSPRTDWLIRTLPGKWPGLLKHFTYMLSGYLMTVFCKYFPLQARGLLLKETKKQLPKRLPVSPHFVPSYNPWEQRLCLCPDGDFYKSLHQPNTNVVTGKIDTVTEDGVQMQDGTKIEADVIVTATGLKMQLGGHVDLFVNGEKTEFKDRLLWNGAMVEDVPNMMYMIGYTNHSWTLGSDDTANVLIRLIKYMKTKDATTAVPRAPAEGVNGYQKMWQLSSTYSRESESVLPRYGNVGPWRPRTRAPQDWLHARYGDIVTGLHFSA